MTLRQNAYRERLRQSGGAQRNYLLDPETLAALTALQARWSCSEVEAVRRAVRAAADAAE